MTNDDRLRAKLIEDTDSPEEADRLLPVARQLSGWSAPAPAAQDTNRLVQILLAELPKRRRAHSWSIWWWLLLAQRRVVQQEIWLASALVMTLGVLVTLASQSARSPEALPLVLIAPLVAAMGIVFLYGPAAEPALEVELATPLSSRLIVLARLLLVFVFDLALGLLGSAALVLVHSDLTLWPLVSLWLAPMTFLAALAFLLSMMSLEPLLGAAICLLLWGTQIVRTFLPFEIAPSLMADNARPWLWLLALLCAGIALWLAGREERRLAPHV